MSDAMKAAKRAANKRESSRGDRAPDGGEPDRRSAPSGSDLSADELTWVSGGMEPSEEEPWSPGHYVM